MAYLSIKPDASYLGRTPLQGDYQGADGEGMIRYLQDSNIAANSVQGYLAAIANAEQSQRAAQLVEEGNATNRAKMQYLVGLAQQGLAGAARDENGQPIPMIDQARTNEVEDARLNDVRAGGYQKMASGRASDRQAGYSAPAVVVGAANQPFLPPSAQGDPTTYRDEPTVSEDTADYNAVTQRMEVNQRPAIEAGHDAASMARASQQKEPTSQSTWVDPRTSVQYNGKGPEGQADVEARANAAAEQRAGPQGAPRRHVASDSWDNQSVEGKIAAVKRQFPDGRTGSYMLQGNRLTVKIPVAHGKWQIRVYEDNQRVQ